MSGPTPPPRYDETYFRDTFPKVDCRAGSTAWWSVRFYAKLAERRLDRSGGRRALDVGCAHGHLLARLEGRFETYGVDLSDYAVENSRSVAPRSRIVQGDIEKGLPAEFTDLRFDLIIARYVLEHLEHPASFLDLAARALSPGGALLISVPNMDSPGRRLKGKDWFAYRDPTHVSLWPPDRWLAEIDRSGLAIETICSDGLWDVPYIGALPSAPQYLMFSVPALVEVLLGIPILPLSWGENLIAIAGRGDRAAAITAGGAR